MLRRVKIERFKNVLSFDEELEAVTVLVGTNNSGKTSVLNAIHTSVAIAQSRRRILGREGGQGVGVYEINAADLLYLPSLETSWLAYNGELTAELGPKTTFTLSSEASSVGSIDIRLSAGRNLKITSEGETVISELEKLEYPFSVYVPGLAGIARSENLLSRGNLLRAVARGDANLVLRNVLSNLYESASKWSRFMHALNQVYPFHNLHILFDKDIDEHILVMVEKNGRRVPLDCIGTGFLQTVQILSYIYLFSPKLTLLDEPDSHLHPNNQRALATLLLQLANEAQTKILMATHSRHMIDALHRRTGVKMTWMKDGSVAKEPSQLALLTDLGALDAAEGLLAGGIDFVVLTEDKNKDLIKSILEANGAPAGRFQVWSYKGCSKLDVAEALAQFIREVSPQSSIIVHRDSDFFADDDKTFLIQQFIDYNIDTFFPPTPDIEGIFCRIEHLKAINIGFEAQVQFAFDRALALNETLLREAARKSREELDHVRHKNRQPTQGEEAIREWARTLDLTMERWRHGKKFQAALRHEFQTITGRALNTDQLSTHLIVPALQQWIGSKTNVPQPAIPAAPPSSPPSTAAPMAASPLTPPVA